MRVLYICSTLKRSGPINQLYYLAENINKYKYDVDILTLSPEPENSMKTKFESMGVDIHSLGLSRIKSLLIGRKKLEKKIENLSPDIVHSHGIRADILNSITDSSVIRVNTSHTNYNQQYPMELGFALGGIVAKSHIRALRELEQPIACSEYVSRMLGKSNIDAKVIYNGVDVNKYSPPDREEKERARKKLDIQFGSEVFIYVGSFTKGKDVETIVEGFKKADLSESDLILVGDGPTLDGIRNEISAENNIRLLGYIPDPELYLMASDYYISASKFEGLPMAVLEAASTGLPICVSDIPPHQEVLSEDPKAGQTFKTESSSDLASSLVDLSEGEYSKKSNRARKVVENSFSSEIMAANYEKEYENLVNSK